MILVVDDKAINLRIIKAALGGDFEVRLANSGQLALSIVAAGRIDLILLDIEMPGMNGFEFVDLMKSSAVIKKKPPVIFVTAHATPGFLAAAKIAGAAGYVLKPFEAEVLRKKVHEVLNSRNAQKR